MLDDRCPDMIVAMPTTASDTWVSLDEYRDAVLQDPVYRAAWDEMALARALGLAVVVRRGELGLSQTALARRAGMAQRQISRIEVGEDEPSLDVLLRLADALGLAIDISIRPQADTRRPAPRTAEGAIVETTDQLVIEVRPAR